VEHWDAKVWQINVEKVVAKAKDKKIMSNDKCF
jgi:hypothetical protein